MRAAVAGGEKCGGGPDALGLAFQHAAAVLASVVFSIIFFATYILGMRVARRSHVVMREDTTKVAKKAANT